MDEKFKEFLAANSVKQCEEILGVKLPWYKRVEIWWSLKWWVSTRESNPKLMPHILFKSIIKGRF